MPIGALARTGSDLRLAAALATGPAVAQGLLRFAYALLLPAMRSDLHWSFTTAGAMNTANALGYLVGSLVVASRGQAIGMRRSFRLGLLGSVIALVLTAATGSTVALLTLRLLTGVLAAVVFVTGAAMVMHLAPEPRRWDALPLAVYLGGVGLGIALSGLVVPWVVAGTSDHYAWRLGWLVLAGLSMLVIPAGWWAAGTVDVCSAAASAGERLPLRSIGALLSSYTLFGAGHTGYMTFIVAYLQSNAHVDDVQVRVFWVVLGVAGMVASLTLSPLVSRLFPGPGICLLIIVVALGAALPLLLPGALAAMGSALVFGGSFLVAITAITAAVRRALPTRHWTTALGVLTTGFAVGQCVGPVLSGAAADAQGGLAAALALSTGVLVLAALVALAQRSAIRPISPTGRAGVDDLRGGI